VVNVYPVGGADTDRERIDLTRHCKVRREAKGRLNGGSTKPAPAKGRYVPPQATAVNQDELQVSTQVTDARIKNQKVGKHPLQLPL